MGTSPVPPRFPVDRSLLGMPVGELLALGAFYQLSRRGSNAPGCWESIPRVGSFVASLYRFQASGPMGIAYDSAQFVFVEDVGACTEIGAEVFGSNAA